MCPSEAELVCYSDGTLAPSRRKDIETHIDRCSKCLSICAELMRSSAIGSQLSAPVDRPPVFGVGALVGGGRYRILRAVGAGAMGQVYEAEDLLLDRRVALKTLGPLLADDPSAAKRLRSEVALAHRVTHPNVCRLYDIGFEALPGASEATNPLPYITMEFLEGPTLAAHSRARGLPSIGEAASILIQIASGLAAAHEVGVIHRDLKADNVMLVRDGGGRLRAVITDFGLARQMDGPAMDELARLSRTHSAPEQLVGRPATAASDVYAFGAMACELLAGPGPGPRTIGGLRRQLNGKGRDAPIPAAMRTWILRATEPDPRQRFADGQALLSAGQRACKMPAAPLLERRGSAAAIAGAIAAAIVVAWLASRRGVAGGSAVDRRLPASEITVSEHARARVRAADTATPTADHSVAQERGLASPQRQGKKRQTAPAVMKRSDDQSPLLKPEPILSPAQPPADIIRELHVSDRRSHADLVGLSTDRASEATEAR